MLTALTIKAQVKEKNKEAVTITWDESAMTLLSLLQQCWPDTDLFSVDEDLLVNPDPDYGMLPLGNGTLGLPYQPRTAEQWFYCAKVKGSGMHAKRFPHMTHNRAWFKVAGRYIGVDPDSFYSSDYGTDKDAVRVDTPVLDAPTYPNLESAVTTWKKKNLVNNTDAKFTAMLRKIMRRETVSDMPDELPVLAVVLLISEVARNHTAFHTNLMALDLIELGAKLPTKSGGTIDWTWNNAIWMEDACPDCGASGSLPCIKCPGTGWLYLGKCGSCTNGVFRSGIRCKPCRGSGNYFGKSCRSCGGSGWFKNPILCNRCDGHGDRWRRCDVCHGGSVRCGRCHGKGTGTVFCEFQPRGVSGGTITSGGQVLQNGLLPMSHRGSAFGSAFDLAGTGKYKKVKGGFDELSKAPSALTVVRRKEATVLIQWLHLLLGKIGLEEELDDGTTITATTQVKASDVSLDDIDFTKSYDMTTALFDVKDDPTLEDRVKQAVRERLLRWMHVRTMFIGSGFE